MKMRIEDILILELCKNEKNSSSIENIFHNYKINLHYFFKIIDKHLIKPFILAEALKYSIPEPVRDILHRAAKEAIFETRVRHQMIKREYNRIQTIVQERGAECILLKGISLDFTGLRMIGDLDILVKEGDFVIADESVRAAGFDYVGDILNPLIRNNEKKDIISQLSWNNQFQYENKKNGILLELHTNLFEKSRAYIFDLNRLLENIDIFWKNRVWNDSLNAYTLCTEDLLMLMCLHTAVKRSLHMNRFILRNLLDISGCIDRGINWDSFLSASVQFDTVSLVFFSLSLAIRLIGINVPDGVMHVFESRCTKGQKLLAALHHKSFYNLESSSIFFSNLYKILCPFVYQKKWFSRLKSILMLPVLFPARWRMAQLFHIKKNNPLIFLTYLINPFRLLFLLIKNIVRYFYNRNNFVG
ncbi:MAG: hypothetical protein A2176_06705 [Spirochaetes bacterium RBG_13_51_14]|nr:MAG: hypothetical protein A2176_06705 [Spirochaetes bacterium RBG_13_51_14]